MNLMEVKVRIVNAVFDLEATEKYILGHHKVLESYGVTKVTSADTSWKENANVFLILVESAEDLRLLGGARIQLNTEETPLPLVGAIKDLDQGIIEYINQFKTLEIAEFCGLWNSKEVAGYGIGSIYLGRVGVAICTQLGVKKLVALSSPATLRNCIKVGFEIINSLGKNGKFYYPKEGLIATALEVNDLRDLPTASEEDRDYIFNLRENMIFTSHESGPRGSLQIDVDLKIPDPATK